MIQKFCRFFSTVPKVKAFVDVKQIKPEKFSQKVIEAHLKEQQLLGWESVILIHGFFLLKQNYSKSVVDGKKPIMKKSFEFSDFTHAFAFMDHVATVADTMDHHPEWTHKNNIVEIVLSTHDCQGVSAKDFILANVIVISRTD